MGTKQHQRTVDAGKHTATVNVAHKNYIGSGMQGHRQIDKVGIPQIDFGDASRAFQHDGIIAGGKAVVGSTNLPAQFVASFLAEIIISIAVADRTPVKNNLRGMVRLWFQQQRIHVRVARHSGGFCLHSLGTAYLQPFGSGK